MKRILMMAVFMMIITPAESAKLPTVVSLQDRLAEQVQRMMSAGHIAPAIPHAADHYTEDAWPKGNTSCYFEFDDYWHNPAETVYTLALAIPHLPANMQAAAKSYLQSEFNLYPPYIYMHSGPGGARRELCGLPPAFTLANRGISFEPGAYYQFYSVADGPRTNSQSMSGYAFNPFNYYACWKYAQVMGYNQSQAASLAGQISGKIEALPSDTVYLQKRPYILNQYIAGYYGYLFLQDMAGQARSATVQGYLNNALQMRLNNLNSVDPVTLPGWEQGGFLYLMPELGDYLYQNARTRVQYVWDYLNWAQPYWEVPVSNEVFRYLLNESINLGFVEGEGSDVYCHWALFQAGAHALKMPREELEKYLHGGATYRGDLYYIQNLAVTLAATPTVIVTLPDGGEVWQTTTAQAVTWTTAGSVGNLNIDLSTNSGASWTNIVSNTPDDGSQSITVPNVVSTACFMRVQEPDGSPSDISNNNFTIQTTPPPPAVTVTSPNGSELWQEATVQTVAWTTQGTVGNLNIDLSTNGGANWINLVAGTINDGNQTITVPATPTLSGRIRISAAGGTPADTSNSNFTIRAPILSDPMIQVSTNVVNFGEIDIGIKKDMTFDIANAGAGTLTGNITSDNDWLTAEPASFTLGEGTNITITVTADNGILRQREGTKGGMLTIMSNTVPSRSIDVMVEFTATCVLVKPNPVCVGIGLPVRITFYGDGIVPGETTIRIYTLSGQIVDTISPSTLPSPIKGEGEGKGEIIWQPQNLVPGIYIYTYASTKERGVGKFTVIER